jgi:hypothetical protein
MPFECEPTELWDQRRLEADQVQSMMEPIHEHLQVEMRWSQALHDEGANRGHLPVPNIPVESKIRLNARNIRTTWPAHKLDWKRLRLHIEMWRNSAYAYEVELPASIQIHRVQPISILDPVVDDPLVGQCVAPPPICRS